jgi:ribonuclease HI
MKAHRKAQVFVPPEPKPQPIDVFCDGSGAGPDGRSGFAAFRPDNYERHVEFRNGLTSNQAEYHAVAAGLNLVPDGSSVRVLTDSLLVKNQLTGRYAVKDQRLALLRKEILRIRTEKRLKLRVKWIPRDKNLADALLRSKK